MRTFNFEAKSKIVLAGNSRVFREWQTVLPNLTEEMFLREIAWLCEDPCDEFGKLTREIGLTRCGIVRLTRLYNGEFTTFYSIATGERWTGDHFYRPCSNPHFADENGMIWEHHKISLSAADRV